jgi:ferredoxin-like protein FixX
LAQRPPDRCKIESDEPDRPEKGFAHDSGDSLSRTYAEYQPARGSPAHSYQVAKDQLRCETLLLSAACPANCTASSPDAAREAARGHGCESRTVSRACVAEIERPIWMTPPGYAKFLPVHRAPSGQPQHFGWLGTSEDGGAGWLLTRYAEGASSTAAGTQLR